MLPFFFHAEIPENVTSIYLEESASKHCIQVLRMKEGDRMLLTDGKGSKVTARIVEANRKKCAVYLEERNPVPPKPYLFSLAIAFTKNNSRNEWLLEKVTELGCHHIYPVNCTRSEKEKFNAERWHNILIAAMLQSQQSWLPLLHPQLSLQQLINIVKDDQKLVAHCIQDRERVTLMNKLQPQQNTTLLIGPEGDFTPDELTLCTRSGFSPVSLGPNRLRTETAALYGCTLFNALNYA